jgi:hypothetical protein
MKKKIEEETELDDWFGIDINNNNIKISDVELLHYLNENNEELFKHCKENNWVVLPDGARLVRTCSEARKQNWLDIYFILKSVIDLNNENKIDEETSF